MILEDFEKGMLGGIAISIGVIVVMTLLLCAVDKQSNYGIDRRLNITYAANSEKCDRDRFDSLVKHAEELFGTKNVNYNASEHFIEVELVGRSRYSD